MLCILQGSNWKLGSSNRVMKMSIRRSASPSRLIHRKEEVSIGHAQGSNVEVGWDDENQWRKPPEVSGKILALGVAPAPGDQQGPNFYSGN